MPEQLPQPGTFYFAVQALDQALTGKSANDCAHMFRDQAEKHMPEGWLFTTDAYYLSDGGYSRVAFDHDKRRLFLTSNSRKEVRDKWDEAKDKIVVVENYLINCLMDVYLREERTGP